MTIQKRRGKSQGSLALIASAYRILAEIQPASVRAVCYQLFTRKLITSMAKNETNKVSRLLRDAREAGTIPWSWIVDETREPERISAWDDPTQYFEVVKRSYRRDRWTDQPVRIEVWSEKGTVRGTLAPVLNTYGVTFMVMHGYGSSTALHNAAEASVSDRRERPLIVLYVGDRDPSGMGMSEVDIPSRISRYGGDVDVRRIAINDDDTADSNLSWFPASDKAGDRHRKGDPRYDWYLKHYGGKCWELDALSPVVLRDRVEHAILDEIDADAWARADVTERAEQESIIGILSTWPGISRQARKYDGGGAR